MQEKLISFEHQDLEKEFKTSIIEMDISKRENDSESKKNT